MNEKLLIGTVFLVVVIALYLLYKGRRPVHQRSPVCHRFGRGEHYGRYCCSACGAHFVLDPTGKPSRSVWGVAYGPVSMLSLAVGCGVVDLIASPSARPVPPLLIMLLMAFGGWELFRTLREKLFTQQDHAG